MTYTMGTLFSGIGVPDLCGRLLGIETLWQVEKEAFPQAVLRKHFPEASLHGDIFDCHDLPYVDLIVAGFPCQPFSVAGKKLAEKDERFLVPEMLRVIDEVRPRTILLENVPHFTSLNDGNSFKQLLQALAAMGFDAEWGHLRAESYGAPHERERWFLVGYAKSFGQGKLQGGITPRLARSVHASASVVSGQSSARKSKPGLGRIIDGFTAGLDGFVGYPAPPGQAQFAYEPPRITTRNDNRAKRLKALGNSMAVDVVFEIMLAIRTWLEAADAESEAA